MADINPKETVNQLSAIAERYLKNPTELKKILDVATKTAASKNATGPIDELFAKVKLLIGMISDTISKKYSAIPWGSLVSIVAALIYFVSPFDLIPDYILGAGYIDDGAVVAFVLGQINSDVVKYRQWKDQQIAGNKEITYYD